MSPISVSLCSLWLFVLCELVLYSVNSAAKADTLIPQSNDENSLYGGRSM